MSTAQFVDIGTLITSTPGVNGGKPCMAGTGTSVQGVSILFNRGMTPESIHAELPHVGIEHIFAALTYYLANKSAVDAAVEADRRLGEKLAHENARALRSVGHRAG